MSKPTQKDAELFLKLYEIFRYDDELKKAFRWFRSLEKMSYEEFKSKYPVDSEGDWNFHLVAGYFEMLGVIVNNGLLNEHLIFDMLGSLQWSKAEPIIHGVRKDREWPRYFENYEVLAKKYPEWAKKNPPKL